MSGHRLMIFLVLVAYLSTGVAHQRKEAYTVIKPNVNTGNTEVIHRFYLHDAEHGFSTLVDRNIMFNGNRKAQAEFAAYVEKSFQMVDSNGSTISLDFIGSEVEGRYFWIYQEVPEKLPCQVTVKMTTFHEVWKKHTNQINFEWPKGVKSVRLTADQAEKSLPIYKCK